MKFTDLLHARDFLAVQREAQRILLYCLDHMDIHEGPDGLVRFTIDGDIALLDRFAIWGRQAQGAERLDADVITDLMHARCYLASQREAQGILRAFIAHLDVRPMQDGVVKFTIVGDAELQDRLAVWGCLVEDLEDEDIDTEDRADDEADDRRGRAVLLTLPAIDLRADLMHAAPQLCAA